MDFRVIVGLTAFLLWLAVLVVVLGWYVVRDHRRHFYILKTATAHGLEPIGMILGPPDVVIGVALANDATTVHGDRFAQSQLCAVVDGRLEPVDSEAVWRAKRARRLVWYGLLRFTGHIGRDNFMGFMRWDSIQRRVPPPAYSDFNLEQSMLLERALPLLVTVAIMAWLFIYALPRI